jgi:ABC-2 type transport system permease protein
MSMLNVVRLPLVFISGVFIPLASIPSTFQFVTYFSPLTYGFDLIHAAYSGTSHFNPTIDVGMLLVFIIIFQVLADRLYNRYKA